MRLPSLFNHNQDLSPFFDWGSTNFSHSFPKWVEGEDKISIDFDMPGVKKEDIKIETKNGFITISGQRESKVKGEFSTYSYSYQTLLPEGVNEDSIDATYNNGVLSLEIKKDNIKPSSKTIQVK